ncbi:MAG: hypothetical protein D6719_12565 [Candidatus Dadabacteria bacterium]|nr:MAG: hypothetical protein D6719_12565 [Candidatus Dadabacteria bacterium]
MTVTRPSIVLFDSDPGVIEDVICSMRLVNIPVHKAESVEAAKKVIFDERPALVLARAKVKDDTKASARLVRELHRSPGLGRIPVVVLCRPSERELVEDDLDLFSGQIELPVEFPAFTQRVQDFISNPVVRKPTIKPAATPVEEAADISSADNQPEIEQSSDSQAEIELPVHDERLLLLYSLQQDVVEHLKQDREFLDLPLYEVPRYIAQVTHSLAAKFKPIKNRKK